MNKIQRIEQIEKELAELKSQVKAEQVDIPEGFTAYDGKGQPVPDDVVIDTYGERLIGATLKAFECCWEDYTLIQAYKIICIPTLTIDDVKEGQTVWLIDKKGDIVNTTFNNVFDYALIFNGMAYATKELAQCARDNKVYCDAYKSMLGGE